MDNTQQKHKNNYGTTFICYVMLFCDMSYLWLNKAMDQGISLVAGPGRKKLGFMHPGRNGGIAEISEDEAPSRSTYLWPDKEG